MQKWGRLYHNIKGMFSRCHMDKHSLTPWAGLKPGGSPTTLRTLHFNFLSELSLKSLLCVYWNSILSMAWGKERGTYWDFPFDSYSPRTAGTTSNRGHPSKPTFFWQHGWDNSLCSIIHFIQHLTFSQHVYIHTLHWVRVREGLYEIKALWLGYQRNSRLSCVCTS